MHLKFGLPVAHDQFGVGFVEAIEDCKITVDFAESGIRKVLASYLRAPTRGLLPYREAELDVSPYVGCGAVPFLVVDGRIAQFVGATIGRFTIESHLGPSHLATFDFVLEQVSQAKRNKGLRRFTEFCRSLGVLEPQDTADLVGQRACLRVTANDEFPTFARLAA